MAEAEAEAITWANMQAAIEAAKVAVRAMSEAMEGKEDTKQALNTDTQ